MRTAAILVAPLALTAFQTTAESASGQLTLAKVIAIAHDAGFACAEPLLTAVAIAVAESSLYPDNRNLHTEYGKRPDGSLHLDRGLWQISSYWWPQYTDRLANDPSSAAQIAFVISAGGTDFTAWDSFNRGNAQYHFDHAYDGWPALRPVVEGFCAGE